MNPIDEAMAMEHLGTILCNAKTFVDDALLEYAKIEQRLGGQHREVKPALRNRLRAMQSGLKSSIEQIAVVVDDMREAIMNSRNCGH